MVIPKNLKKPKSTRDQIKELEEKIYGQKNKKKTESIRKQIEKLKLEEKLAKKKNDDKKIIGTEKKGAAKKNENKLAKEEVPFKKDDKVEIKRVCRFLLESQSRVGFVCPDPMCKDIHSLEDMDGEMDLEEYLEVCRCSLVETTTLTKELFYQFVADQERRNEAYEKKKEMLRTGQKMFIQNPDVFIDDENATDLDYKERCYSEEGDTAV